MPDSTREGNNLSSNAIPLIRAAAEGDAGAVRALLDEGAAVAGLLDASEVERPLPRDGHLAPGLPRA